MEQLKVLPPDTTEFEANGVRYTFEEGLSMERYRFFEKMRLEAGFGLSMNELREVFKQNIDLMERFAQGEKVYSQLVALNYNTLKGSVNMEAKYPFAAWLNTLFWNTKDEDRRWFKEEVMREKIVNWETEGIEQSFFISRACALIGSFNKIYEEITQMSLVWGPGENPLPPAEEQLPPAEEQLDPA